MAGVGWFTYRNTSCRVGWEHSRVAESRAIQRTGNITWPKGHIGSHLAWVLTRHKLEMELWWRTAQNETLVVSRPDHVCYLWFNKGTLWPLPNIPNKSVIQNNLGPQESLALWVTVWGLGRALAAPWRSLTGLDPTIHLLDLCIYSAKPLQDRWVVRPLSGRNNRCSQTLSAQRSIAIRKHVPTVKCESSGVTSTWFWGLGEGSWHMRLSVCSS